MMVVGSIAMLARDAVGVEDKVSVARVRVTEMEQRQEVTVTVTECSSRTMAREHVCVETRSSSSCLTEFGMTEADQ